MKKLFLFLLAAFVFTACDDSDEKNADNVISYDGTTYKIAAANMEYYGNIYYSEFSENIDIIFAEAGGHYMILEMNVPIPNATEKLTAGTYNYSNNETHPANTFVGGLYDANDNGFEITAGTVTVALAGNTYTVNLNCTLENGKTVTGKYEGAFIYAVGNVDYGEE